MDKLTQELNQVLDLGSKEILTRKEVAELLSIDLSTLWSWTKKGNLKAYGIGNKVFYKYSEILQEALVPLHSNS